LTHPTKQKFLYHWWGGGGGGPQKVLSKPSADSFAVGRRQKEHESGQYFSLEMRVSAAPKDA
jgi:hypothetical protein